MSDTCNGWKMEKGDTGLSFHGSFSDLDVLHVLKEVRLWVVVVGELHQVSELLLGGKGLYQAGQNSGVVMLHTLLERGERVDDLLHTE